MFSTCSRCRTEAEIETPRLQRPVDWTVMTIYSQPTMSCLLCRHCTDQLHVFMKTYTPHAPEVRLTV
jgi:hypothetical protein